MGLNLGLGFRVGRPSSSTWVRILKLCRMQRLCERCTGMARYWQDGHPETQPGLAQALPCSAAVLQLFDVSLRCCFVLRAFLAKLLS